MYSFTLFISANDWWKGGKIIITAQKIRRITADGRKIYEGIKGAARDTAKSCPDSTRYWKNERYSGVHQRGKGGIVHND